MVTEVVASINGYRDDRALVQWAKTTMQFVAAQARLESVYLFQYNYDRLDIEYPNIRRMLGWLCEQISQDEEALLLEYLSTLAPYLLQRNLHSDLLHWCQVAINSYRSEGWFWHLIGQAQSALGLRDDAMLSFQQALSMSETTDSYTYALTILDIGRLRLHQGSYQQALTLLTKAEELLRYEEDMANVVAAQEERVQYYVNQGELDKALSLYLDIERTQIMLTSDRIRNDLLLSLGAVYRRKRQYALALSYFQRLLEQGEAQKQKGAIATASHHLAWVYLEQGKCELAQRLCGCAIALYEEMGDIRGLSDAYEQLGCIALEEQCPYDAIVYFKKCLPIRQQIHSRYGTASCLRRLAIAYVQTRALLKAGQALLQCLLLYSEMGLLNWRRLQQVRNEFRHYLFRRPR